jgi:hypothetical protein
LANLQVSWWNACKCKAAKRLAREEANWLRQHPLRKMGVGKKSSRSFPSPWFFSMSFRPLQVTLSSCSTDPVPGPTLSRRKCLDSEKNCGRLRMEAAHKSKKAGSRKDAGGTEQCIGPMPRPNFLTFPSCPLLPPRLHSSSLFLFIIRLLLPSRPPFPPLPFFVIITMVNDAGWDLVGPSTMRKSGGPCMMMRTNNTSLPPNGAAFFLSPSLIPSRISTSSATAKQA